MNMRTLAARIARQTIDEMTVADRVTLAMELGGRRAQDLVVTLGITRTEAKQLLRLRDQLGRSCSPCMMAMSAAY